MVYRIAHCADWHIGYSSGKLLSQNGVNLRVMDGYNALETVVSDIINTGVDAMVMAGDVFHTPYPSPRDIYFVQQQIRRLSKAGIKVFMLAGNHDASDIESDLQASRVLHDEDKHIYSFVDPYTRIEMFDGLFLHMVSHHQYLGQQRTFDSIEQVSGCVNLFTTHGSVVDPILNMVLSTPQSPREIVIPDFLLDGWDYCLLGHIHERKQVSDRMLYNGSLLRRGFADKECEMGRGWTLIRVEADGRCSFEPKRVFERPQVDLPTIDCLGLSRDEINERLEQNICVIHECTKPQGDVATKSSGNNIDLVLAPIVRQKFINCDFTVRVGVASSLINNVRKTCFSFDTVFEKPVKAINKVNISVENDSRQVSPEEVEIENVRGLSLVDQYEAWSTQDRDVKKLARNAIEKGMVKVFDND